MDTNLSFSEFVRLVKKDLGDEYRPGLDVGFRDWTENTASSADGYSFNLPSATRYYAWWVNEGWYYCGTEGSGSGESLELAIQDSVERECE